MPQPDGLRSEKLGMVSDVKKRNTMLKIKLALQYGTYSMAFTQLIMLQTQLNFSSFPLLDASLVVAEREVQEQQNNVK